MNVVLVLSEERPAVPRSSPTLPRITTETFNVRNKGTQIGLSRTS